MNRRHRYLSGLTLLFILVGCIGSVAPTPPAPATSVPTLPPPTLPPPTAAAACQVTTQTAVDIYQRPANVAARFGTLAAGDSVAPTLRSADGWLGFDPGVAQAANIGVFRLRWVSPEADAALSGDCAALPPAPPLSPNACYFMAPIETTVYAAPDSGSTPVLILPAGGYTAVTGRTTSGWLALDFADGSTAQSGSGWLNPADANLNGPCSALPEVTSP